MKKKTKLITISFLGLLLLVPFMGLSRAQVPPYVGVAEGDHEEWDVYIWRANFTQWNADSMSDEWATVFQQSFLDNMTAVYATAEKAPTPPHATCYYTVDSIINDTDGFDENSDGGITSDETWASPGNTLVNMTTDSGTFMDFSGWPYYYYFSNGTGIIIGNNSAEFAEDIGYGAMATSAIWATNMFNSGNINWEGSALDANMTNTIFWSPKGVNWAEVAGNCTTGLETNYGIFGTYGYNITVSALSNGFEMFVDVGDFGSNTETITLTLTYDSNGLLTYHSFKYGSDILVEIFYADSTYPVITETPTAISVEYDYTGLTFEWTATDANPDQYAILQDDVAIVFPTAWASGVQIVFAIPDGLPPGDYVFKINIRDSRPNRPNVASDEVSMHIREIPPDATLPLILTFSIVFGFLGALAVVIVMVERKNR